MVESFTAETPASAGPVVPAESIAAIQITRGQAALALRAFGEGGLLSDRFDFKLGISKVRYCGVDGPSCRPGSSDPKPARRSTPPTSTRPSSGC